MTGGRGAEGGPFGRGRHLQHDAQHSTSAQRRRRGRLVPCKGGLKVQGGRGRLHDLLVLSMMMTLADWCITPGPLCCAATPHSMWPVCPVGLTREGRSRHAGAPRWCLPLSGRQLARQAPFPAQPNAALAHSTNNTNFGTQRRPQTDRPHPSSPSKQTPKRVHPEERELCSAPPARAPARTRMVLEEVAGAFFAFVPKCVQFVCARETLFLSLLLVWGACSSGVAARKDTATTQPALVCAYPAGVRVQDPIAAGQVPAPDLVQGQGQGGPWQARCRLSAVSGPPASQ